MADGVIPVFRVGGVSAWYIILVVVVFFGATHLLAAAKPDNPLAKAWVWLGF